MTYFTGPGLASAVAVRTTSSPSGTSTNLTGVKTHTGPSVEATKRDINKKGFYEWDVGKVIIREEDKTGRGQRVTHTNSTVKRESVAIIYLPVNILPVYERECVCKEFTVMSIRARVLSPM